MLETTLNFVIGGLFGLYERFGRWFVVAAGAVAVLLVVLLMYCFGVVRGPGGIDRAEAQRRVDEQARREAAEEAEDGRKNAVAAAKRKAELAAAHPKRTSPVPAAVAAKPVQPAVKIAAPLPEPARPKNLADWKRDDYLAARREGDARLPEAIEQLAGRFPDSDPAANLLVSLLQAAPGTGSLSGGAGGRDSTTTIVDALVANRSRTAREGLVGLLGGSIQTPNDRGIVTAALRALARRSEPADEDLLLAAAVEKTSRDEPLLAMVKGATTAMSASELQKAAAGVIQATASEDLRLRLAKRILQPNLPPADRARLIECVKESRPENLAAQALLFTSPELEPVVLARFQQHFMQCSSAALAKLSGIPLGRDARGVSPMPAAVAGSKEIVAKPLQLPDVDPAMVARALWTQPFCEALDQRLTQARSLSDSRGLVMLAATIPLPAARSALQRTLERFWYEGPSPLSGTAWLEDFLPDPGLLFVLKSLPHHSVTIQTPNAAPRKIHASSKKSAKAVLARTAALETRDVKQKQDQIALAWLQKSDIFVRTMIERLHAAALVRKTDPRKVADEVADVPVSFDPAAGIVAAAAVDLPGAALAAANSPVEPLRIRYWRVEAKAKPAAIVAQCKRQLKDCEQRSMPYGVWFDGYQDDPQSAHKVSMDVVIRKAVPDAPVTADQEQYLVIEVLSVETATGTSQAHNDQAVPGLTERSSTTSPSSTQIGAAQK